MAQAALSATTSSSSAASFSSSGRNFRSPLFPMAITAFRRKPDALRPPHRRAAKRPAEFFRAHLRQPVERRIHQLRPRLKLSGVRRRRFPVPRTNILADVAAEDVPPHPAAQFVIRRKRAALFDREIRDALVGIELIRCDQCVSRAGVDAARATAAAIGRGHA